MKAHSLNTSGQDRSDGLLAVKRIHYSFLDISLHHVFRYLPTSKPSIHPTTTQSDTTKLPDALLNRHATDRGVRSSHHHEYDITSICLGFKMSNNLITGSSGGAGSLQLGSHHASSQSCSIPNPSHHRMGDRALVKKWSMNILRPGSQLKYAPEQVTAKKEEDQHRETSFPRSSPIGALSDGATCPTTKGLIDTLGAHRGTTSLYRLALAVLARNVDSYDMEYLDGLPNHAFDALLVQVGHYNNNRDTLGSWWWKVRRSQQVNVKLSRNERKRIEIIDFQELMQRLSIEDITLPILSMSSQPGYELLTTLHLHKCPGLTDDTCLTLSKLTGLQSLYTTHCSISNLGIRSLAAAIDTGEEGHPMKGLLKLQAWWLDGCGLVTDKGVSAFVKFPNLRMLGLSLTSVTELAGKHLLNRADNGTGNTWRTHRMRGDQSLQLPYSQIKTHLNDLIIVAQHAEQARNVLRNLDGSRDSEPDLQRVPPYSGPHLAVFAIEEKARQFPKALENPLCPTQTTLPLTHDRLRSTFLWTPSEDSLQLRDWSCASGVIDYWWQKRKQTDHLEQSSHGEMVFVRLKSRPIPDPPAKAAADTSASFIHTKQESVVITGFRRPFSFDPLHGLGMLLSGPQETEKLAIQTNVSSNTNGKRNATDALAPSAKQQRALNPFAVRDVGALFPTPLLPVKQNHKEVDNRKLT